MNSLPERYNSLPTGAVNTLNFEIGGQKISQMNEYALKRLSVLTKQAFRYNGRTIK